MNRPGIRGGSAVSPDGRQVYAAGGRCNCVFAVDTRTDRITTIVQRVGRRPWGVAVTRDGRKVYTANGRSVNVVIRDRGPYAGPDRIIDLSPTAFSQIGGLGTGILSVQLQW